MYKNEGRYSEIKDEALQAGFLFPQRIFGKLCRREPGVYFFMSSLISLSRLIASMGVRALMLIPANLSSTPLLR